MKILPRLSPFRSCTTTEKKIHFAQKIRIHAMLHNHNRNAFARNINTQRKLQHFFHTNGSQIHLEWFDASSSASFISYLPNGYLIFFFERGFRNKCISVANLMLFNKIRLLYCNFPRLLPRLDQKPFLHKLVLLL